MIGALSNVVPELWSDLVRSANSGNFDRTMALAVLIEKLALLYEMDSNCSLMMKKLMVHRGLEISDRAVFPFNQMDEAVYQKAVALLDSVLEEYCGAAAVTNQGEQPANDGFCAVRRSIVRWHMEYHNPTLRVIRILEQIDANPAGTSLTELSGNLDLPKGTISPILKTLAATGYVLWKNSRCTDWAARL